MSNYIKALDSRLSMPKFNKNDLNNTQQFVKRSALARASAERSDEDLSRSPRGKQVMGNTTRMAG